MRGINAKLWFVFSFIFVAFVIIDIRLGYLQIIKHDFYKKKSRSQMQRMVTLSPERGEILDRNGVALATSVKAYSIYADLFEMKDRSKVATLLAQNLSSYNTRMWDRMTHFVWVKRKAPLETKASLTVSGLHFLPDVRRMYPFRERAGQILGFVNVDDRGLSGLEYYFNYHLNGKPGTLILESDAQGKNMYSYNQKIVPAKNGKKLQLTIDHQIQFMMESQLQKSVDSLQAEGGLAILMDIHSGEILGMANYPFFDPNRYFDYKDMAIFKNNAIQMSFEPGSVMKLFTIASAIEERLVKMSDKIYIPEKMMLGGWLIEEAHGGESGEKRIEDILIKSINVGAAMVGLKLGSEKLYHYLSLLEFGRKTGIELAGESSGIVNPYSAWREIDLSRIAFGYNISVTPLQLLKAVSVFGNEGLMVDPYIVKHDRPKHRRYKRVYSPGTVKEVAKVMRKTVEEGTGELTKINCFSVGGKTGTARRFSQQARGYAVGEYTNSFLGIFPLEKPRFAMIVVIMNPRTTMFASQTAVPAFKGIATQVLRYLRIPPDQMPTRNMSPDDWILPALPRPTPPVISTPSADPVVSPNEVLIPTI